MSVAAATADPDLRGQSVFAIDTLSRIYQLFHALPEMTAPDGTPVSAVFGFSRDLLDIVGKKKPDYLFCAHAGSLGLEARLRRPRPGAAALPRLAGAGGR